MLLCREQHIVQQVNIGIAAEGVVKRVIGIVHGARLLDQNWLKMQPSDTLPPGSWNYELQSDTKIDFCELNYSMLIIFFKYCSADFS